MIRWSQNPWLLAGVAGLLVACGGGDDGGKGKKPTPKPTDAAVTAPKPRDPVRCARMDTAKTATLAVDELVIGVVADSRGARAPTLERLKQIRAELDRHKVNLIISLGGLGRTEPDIRSALQLLAKPGKRLVVALPGDREAVAAHREAIATLAGGGANIRDGSRLRFIITNTAVVGTLPGVGNRSQLVAGHLGCIHPRADVDAFAAKLAGYDKLRIWASYAPPRQQGLAGSDLTRAGVHIGEPDLADAVKRAKPRLVLHGLVDAAATGKRGKVAANADGAVYLASGSADTLPATLRTGQRRSGTALVVWVSAKGIRWQRL